MYPASVILWPIAALLAGLLVELLLARTLSPRGKGWLAFVASLAALGGVAAAYPAIWNGQTLDVNLARWNGPGALAYHVDGLSLLFALMAAGIGAVVLLYSVAYMERERGATRFYALMLVFIAGLIQLVYSADWILLYLSWETIGLCSFLLVGFWYQQKEAAAGARKVLVMTHLAGYGLLAAILLLFARTGSTLWTDPRVAGAFSTGIFALMLLAAMAKSVQFPLHTWIPDAMAAPTPVSALLHAACYVKAGIYLLARLHSFGIWQAEWQTTVIWIGTVTMLVGVLYALVQTDLKRLLAFHTVSQIGYIVLGLGLGTPLGIAAALLHCLNHALFKGGLFLCAGAVEHSAGTRDLDRLGGLARRMPRTTVLWLILAGSIAGVPLLSGFVSKWLLFNAALQVGQPLPALISWIVSILTVFSFLKATGGAFLGNESPGAARAHESPRAMLLGAGALAAGSVLLGVMPQFAVSYLINPLLPALGASPVIGVSWLGLTTSSGSWYASGGLVLGGVAVGAGALVFYLARVAPLASRMPGAVAAVATGGGVFTGGEPLSGAGRLPAADFSLLVKQGLAPFYYWADVDRYYRSLWRGLLRVSEEFERFSRVLERNAIPATISLTLLVFALGLSQTIHLDPKSLSAVTPPLDVATPLLIAAGVSLFALLMAVAVIPHTDRLLRLMSGAGLLVVLGLAVEQPLLRLVALEAADLLALALVWQTARVRRAAQAYLIAVVLSALAVVAGMVALNVAPEIAPALLLTAFALKLALVPVYLWLPSVAEAAPAPVVGFVVSVVDVAAFGELVMLRETAPWIFAPSTLWIALALLSSLGGGVLMLAQRDMKRLLAFSSIQDLGYLVLGVTFGGAFGLTGAVLGITVHAVAKVLLFVSLSAVERDEPATLASRGLAARYPISAVGFLVGALAALGIPPLAGYAARWSLYAIAAETQPMLLVILLAAAACAVLAYARVITVCWWGPGPLARRGEPALVRAAVVGLSLVVVVLGLLPNLI